MKLFESSWRDGFSFYERYYDTQLKKSVKKLVDLPYEWYEPSSNGIYTSILDESIRLEKKQGNAKQGKDQYGFLDPMYRNIRDNYWNKDAYNINPNIWYLDIETRVGTVSTGFPVPEKAAEPISLMQFYDTNTSTMFVLGLRDWKHQNDYNFDYTVKYVKCKNEIELLENFLTLFQRLDPLIVYAWNGMGFDYPYIFNRLKNLGIDTDRLSNYGKTKLTQSEFQGRTDFSFSSDGHFFIDLMDVYKKFVFSPRPSYSLDTIAEIELGDKKVQHTEYAGFDDFYTGKYVIPNEPNEYQLNSKIYQEAIKNGVNDEVRELAHSEFVYYGIKDTYLIKQIDNKLNFTALMNMIAEKMGVQIGDSMGTVKPWSQYILNKSYLKKQIMPQRKEFGDPHVVGGYVRDPNKGKHKWVISADVNSMYPLLGMVGFNMSPETFIPKYKLPDLLRDLVLTYFNDQNEANRLDLSEDVWNTVIKELQEHNLALGINGAVFNKDKLGMVPEMVQSIYDSRKQAKKTMFKYEQQKILIKEILKYKKENN